MRTDFLVHWTGRHIQTHRLALTDAQRHQYVELLASILKDGFRMTIPPEKLHGRRESWIKYEAPMVCFTELRLSQAEEHTHKYGLMGIGVTRRFVLERWGGPVHYVRNHCSECIVGNMKAIHAALTKLKECGEPEPFEYFAVNAAFVKAMSEHNTDDFAHLDEQEWRIVHTNAMADEIGKIVRVQKDGNEEYFVPLHKNDVRLLVLPDDRTRDIAMADPRVGKGLDVANTGSPVLVTVAECTQF